KQRVEGSGAAGARPPLASLRHPVYLPEWGAVARGFWGSKFPLGVPYLHPSLPLYLPRAPHKFSPVCPYFLSPGSPSINFPPIFFIIYQIFSKFFPRGGPIYGALPPAGRPPVGSPTRRR